ncbi:MAG: 2-C-methyl-D-erythritol 4-phosphate cytidylyltransferase [Desulfovibrio sp.]|jgi:2-C-methyl-D-erythritol 4-phosphate cytidylyltransferase|nr:2-C-methyl-D-erythritol 4-phosphate cytidylyltransferase [Desulfovibrio sp.]
MNYGVILAGGSGSRLKSAAQPKQFIVLGGKALLTFSVETFLACPNIDRVIVAAPPDRLGQTRAVLEGAGLGRAEVCAGGEARQDSLLLALRHIESVYGLEDWDMAVSHDAARPFVSARVIRENVRACAGCGAADTVIPATDTIVVSEDGATVGEIPPRETMYLSQTPQTFFIGRFLSICERLAPGRLGQVTDAARILCEGGVRVALVFGDLFNIKITTDFDLVLARHLLGEGKIDRS